MRNTLGDMHNILMGQLERLDDASLEEINSEVERSKSMAELATAINANAKVMMEAARLSARIENNIPTMLLAGSNE